MMTPDDVTWVSNLPTDFMRHGSCVGMDTNLFFPIKGESNKEALEACNGRPDQPGRQGRPPCPVRQECLEYALSLPSLSIGIWGGTSQRERRRLRMEPTPVRYR